MKLMELIAATALALGFATGASAQNLQLNQNAAVMETATAQWAVNIFSGTNFAAAIIEENADHDIVQVTAPGGAAFYISARGCDTSTPKNCNMLQTFALFDGAGVTLNQINTMVRDNFIVSYAFLNEDGNGVLATKIILAGGVTEGNVVEELGAYLQDIDNLIAAIASGPLAEVKFDMADQRAGAGRSKILNDSIAGGDYVVNAVGPTAAKFLTDETKAFFD